MNKVTYRDAGVDTKVSDSIISDVKTQLDSNNNHILSKIGAFSSLFKLPEGYKKPVLVSATDGVGTKLQLAIAHNIHTGVGKDLVAMCVNDLITSGGKPLFFLDYFASGKLNENITKSVISSINDGCKIAGCSLIGGETAEMPGMYKNEDYDLAGFAVGVVEEESILPNKEIIPGMHIVGIESSGFHSNGYSLIRKLIDLGHIDPKAKISDENVYDLLLKETFIYTKPVLEVIRLGLAISCAHITGGGFFENIPRSLPEGIGAKINLSSWQAPSIYNSVFNKPFIDKEELLNVFNCGIGFTIVCSPDKTKQVIETIQKHSFKAYHIGETIPEQNKNVVFTGDLSTR